MSEHAFSLLFIPHYVLLAEGIACRFLIRYGTVPTSSSGARKLLTRDRLSDAKLVRRGGSPYRVHLVN